VDPCIGNEISYTASAPSPTTAQATPASYRWTIPANTTIISYNTDSSTVVIRYNVGFTGGTIGAKAVSGANVLSAALYSITLKYAMVAPNAITSSTGNYAACVGSSITYTVGMPVLTATQRAASVYRWTVPSNTTITGAASDSSNITLQYSTGFVGGSISVKSQSSCGTQSALSLIHI
jgi:hypothetical protein